MCLDAEDIVVTSSYFYEESMKYNVNSYLIVFVSLAIINSIEVASKY